MAGEREAVAMATCWQLLSLCLESTGCSLSIPNAWEERSGEWREVREKEVSGGRR